MFILIAVIWLILSLVAIHIDQYRWDGLYKVLLGSTILALLFNGWTVYDPYAVTGYAVTIELNPTWNEALLLSFAEGACITGPIAAIHAFQDWLCYDKGININPFRRLSEDEKEYIQSYVERERELKRKAKAAQKKKDQERIQEIRESRKAYSRKCK
jgi:hypothetical protein